MILKSNKNSIALSLREQRFPFLESNILSLFIKPCLGSLFSSFSSVPQQGSALFRKINQIVAGSSRHHVPKVLTGKKS